LNTTANLTIRNGANPISSSYENVGHVRDGYNKRIYVHIQTASKWWDHADMAHKFQQNLRAVGLDTRVHMAWPTNSLQNAAVLEVANSSGATEWLGISRDSSDQFGYYSRSTGFVDAGDLTYSNWKSGEPNNHDGGESGTQLYSDGQWNDQKNFKKLSSVYEVNPHWSVNENTYEKFKDYSYDWESNWNPIFDLRFSESFSWTSNASPVFDFVPVFEEVTYQKEVASFETRTVWEEQALTQAQSRLVTDVTYVALDALGGGFNGQTLSAANIEIWAAGNASINGVIAADDSLDVQAGQNIVVSGKTAAGADLPSVATLTAGSN
jgi:hypothetical protein